MDTIFARRLPRNDTPVPDAQPPKRDLAGATAGFGGGDNEPVLIATVDGPVQIEMAKDALVTAGIPAYVKQNSLGPIYGLSVGSFGAAEVWVLPALAEQARDTLIGIGVLEPSGDDTMADAE